MTVVAEPMSEMPNQAGPPPGQSGQKMSGKVKWFDAVKGWGFIQPHDNSEDVFVHQQSILTDGFRSLEDGEEVEYQVETDPNGRKRAANVTGPNGAPVKGSSRSMGGPGGRGGFGGGRGGGSYGRGGSYSGGGGRRYENSYGGQGAGYGSGGYNQDRNYNGGGNNYDGGNYHRQEPWGDRRGQAYQGDYHTRQDQGNYQSNYGR